MNMDPKHCQDDEYQIPSFCSDELSGLLAARVLSYSASWTNWSWSVFVLLIPFLFKLGLFPFVWGGGGSVRLDVVTSCIFASTDHFRPLPESGSLSLCECCVAFDCLTYKCYFCQNFKLLDENEKLPSPTTGKSSGPGRPAQLSLVLLALLYTFVYILWFLKLSCTNCVDFRAFLYRLIVNFKPPCSKEFE